MSWIITLPIGILLGIMFSVAFPGIATEINAMIFPTVENIVDKSIEIGVDVIKNKTGVP